MVFIVISYNKQLKNIYFYKFNIYLYLQYDKLLIYEKDNTSINSFFYCFWIHFWVWFQQEWLLTSLLTFMRVETLLTVIHTHECLFYTLLSATIRAVHWRIKPCLSYFEEQKLYSRVSEADWDQKASATIHTKKFKNLPKLLQKASFLTYFVWEIVKAPAINVGLLLWPVCSCIGFQQAEYEL
jgi:hypothetical protein